MMHWTFSCSVLHLEHKFALLWTTYHLLMWSKGHLKFDGISRTLVCKELEFVNKVNFVQTSSRQADMT